MAFSTLVTGPAETLYSLAELKAHVRADSADEDTLIASLGAAASGYMDARNGVLGRALVTQTWRRTLPYFSGSISLPLPPVQSVSSVKYYDTDNVEQTFAPSNYRVVLTPDAATIELADGVSWPSTFGRSDAVNVDYVTGYGGASEVPDEIKQAGLLLVGGWHQHREAMTFTPLNEAPMAVQMLLMPFRVAEGHF